MTCASTDRQSQACHQDDSPCKFGASAVWHHNPVGQHKGKEALVTFDELTHAFIRPNAAMVLRWRVPMRSPPVQLPQGCIMQQVGGLALQQNAQQCDHMMTVGYASRYKRGLCSSRSCFPALARCWISGCTWAPCAAHGGAPRRGPWSKCKADCCLISLETRCYRKDQSVRDSLQANRGIWAQSLTLPDISHQALP